jgi:Carboxypeptidase regulatory-like domain
MQLMKRSHLFLCALALAGAVFGQSVAGDAAAPARATASLQGQVAKDPGGDPVKKALIELIAENQSEAGNYTAVTAADGTFHIEGITPGRYHLFAERTGFLEVEKNHARADGRVLTLAAGQETKDILIRLQAAAVVEGRVTDEDGDPLPNADVSVLKQTYVAGRTRWEPAGTERTNDLGEYRVAGLAAGSYYISASPPPDFKSMIDSTGNAPATKNSSAPAKAATSYQTTYYPGTRDRGQALPVQLHAGDDFPANFSLTSSPSLTIRGSIANLPPGASAMVMLQAHDFTNVVNGGETRRDGSFEVRDVSPGSYTLAATVNGPGGPMMARQSLQVTSENVEGLRLAPQTGAWVRGRVHLEANRNGARFNSDPRQLFLALRSADADDDALGAFSPGEGFSAVARVNADGGVEWRNVPPGNYFVELAGGSLSPEWFLKSVSAGNRERDDVGIVVNGGTVAFEIVASANGATLDGLAATAKGEAVPNALVVAVPATRFQQRPDRYRRTFTDQSGRFTLRALPPGDYIVYAWESLEGEAYYNTEFLKSYEGQGSALHVSEGERKSVQIEAVPAAEEQQ